MNLEPRTVEMSEDNYHAALESFLRATDVIKDSETPCDMIIEKQYPPLSGGHGPIKVTIHFKQEEKKDQTTVH